VGPLLRLYRPQCRRYSGKDDELFVELMPAEGKTLPLILRGSASPAGSSRLSVHHLPDHVESSDVALDAPKRYFRDEVPT
jgi:hypothetical protein